MDARDFAEAQADPLLGTTVGGRYRIIERIGVGGMGTVYRATQAGLERQVALKILKRDLTWDRDTVTRFHREARAMSLLTHPNTVRVFDFGQTRDGLLYFAMELLEGELLTARIEREGALDVRDAIRVTQQILRSLSEAHTKGIIHRDLKPDNIYLARIEGHPEPVVKVLDFGIAKVIQGDRMIDQLETQAGTVFGTPRYMSPEQAQGKRLDPRSDIYSVGILLYQLLTGRAPFVDDDAVVVMAKHIRERPDPLRAAAPDRPIPPSLDRVVLRALEKDPDRRHKTAERFAVKLEACLPDVEAEIAGRKSLWGAVRRAYRGAPKAPLAAGAAVLTGACILAAVMVVRAGGGSEEESVVASGHPPAAATGPQEDRQETASLTVRSDPPGAEVWWQGSLLGTTPLTVERPRGSRMDVALRLDGFEVTEADLVADGRAHTVALTALPAREVEDAESEAEPAGEVAEADRTVTRRRRARPRRSRIRKRSDEHPDRPSPTPPRNPGPDEPYERW